MNVNNRCPQCGEERMKTWNELGDEEREVVRRLPGSVDFSARKRQTHQWCTRCWHEEVDTETQV